MITMGFMRMTIVFMSTLLKTVTLEVLTSISQRYKTLSAIPIIYLYLPFLKTMVALAKYQSTLQYKAQLLARSAVFLSL